MHFLPDRTKMESESEEDLAEQAELFSTYRAQKTKKKKPRRSHKRPGL
jgi:hypothetical protein